MIAMGCRFRFGAACCTATLEHAYLLGIAVREEGISHNLGGLTPSGIITRLEAWHSIRGAYSRIAVSTDDTSSRYSLDELVEGMRRGYIGEGLP